MFNCVRAGTVPLCLGRAQCQKAGVSLAQSLWPIINNYHVVFTGLRDSYGSISELTVWAKGIYLASPVKFILSWSVSSANSMKAWSCICLVCYASSWLQHWLIIIRVHRIIEGSGLEGTLKITHFQPPSHGEVCLPLVQVAQSSMKSSLEQFQRWMGCP